MWLEALFRAPEMPLSTPGPSTEWATSTAVSSLLKVHAVAPKLLATTSATLLALGMSSIASARTCLISSPVLIFTGHFSWHMPSAAQVALPS